MATVMANTIYMMTTDKSFMMRKDIFTLTENFTGATDNIFMTKRIFMATDIIMTTENFMSVTKEIFHGSNEHLYNNSGQNFYDNKAYHQNDEYDGKHFADDY
mmetsp:Transcript_47625/g.92980  ORF Transcript_47625/g.92980 Transcript_47625/m.92980 type:complete len:102 (-) Transcript_47625:10-315(-)